MDGAEEGLESDFRNFEANLPVEMLGPRPLDSWKDSGPFDSWKDPRPFDSWNWWGCWSNSSSSIYIIIIATIILLISLLS